MNIFRFIWPASIATICFLASDSICAQHFRQPAIPGLDESSAPVVGQPFPQSALLQGPTQSSAQTGPHGFVPGSSNDGLGLVPVRPRGGILGQNDFDQFRPDFSGGRTGEQERIIAQIRAGNFDAHSDGDEQRQGSQTIRQRYGNGKDQLVRQVTQDKNGNYFNHGPWKLFNRRGELMANGQFINGVMDGTWQRWHTAGSGGMFQTKPFTEFDGPFISTATFSDGKLEGVWVVSDRYRRKIVEVPYRNGKRTGTATWWFPSSERMRVINFKNGTLDGSLLEWNEKNQLVRNDEYIKGQKVIRTTTFYRPKQQSSETYHLDSELVLDGKDSWWDAEPAEYVQGESRVQHGPTFAWHPNGQRKMVGQYQNDVRVGMFVWWHENGQKALAGRYQDGLKEGVWTWWHASGMKSIEGDYQGDQPIGEWVWWDSNGRIKNRDDLGENPGSNGLLVDPNSDSDSSETSPDENARTTPSRRRAGTNGRDSPNRIV